MAKKRDDGSTFVPEAQPTPRGLKTTVPGEGPTPPTVDPGAWTPAVGVTPGTLDPPTGQKPAPVASSATFLDAEPTDGVGSTDLAEPLPERYRLVGLLGRGGTGVVYAAEDLDLGRRVALKVLRPELSANRALSRRFRAEAALTARLQHPGIIPIFERGRLPDGRLYYTMPEVRGRTLADLLSYGGLSQPELIDVIRRVASAVAYAHRYGIVHRDLKSANVMVGQQGEVWVLDWGLAGLERAREAGVMGTPAYMAPEQARGESVDRRTDVYALGAMLYEMLAGRPPYVPEGNEDGQAMLVRVRSSAPPPVDARGGVDAALAGLCNQAMARKREDRLSDASIFVVGLERWLEAARRRTDALALVIEAARLRDQARGQRADAARMRAEAAMLLVGVRSWDPAELKREGWSLEDRATALEIGADEQELHMRWRLEAALSMSPELETAHAALAEWHRERHVEAESKRDTRGATLAMASLKRHDRGAHRAYVDGDAWLTLETDRPAVARLSRFVLSDRRLVLEPSRPLGRTPLLREPVGAGSWMIELQPDDGPVTRVPVWLGREGHWHGQADPGARPRRLILPRASELGPDEVWVPGGPCWLGGDPEAYSPLARSWANIEGFVMERYPVTQARYLDFLNDLVERDREEEALLYAPRERASGPNSEGALIYGRREGRFELLPDADGDMWSPQWPVMMVTWAAAGAFAAWYARRTRQPWRLPTEREWEKAARGVDGRWFPWGDFLDPSWCRIASSQKGRALPVDIGTYPTDESPYGVRELGGNMRCWCADPYTTSGDGQPAEPNDPNLQRVVRGGSFYFSPIGSRAASRYQLPQTNRTDSLGIRLVRSWPAG